MASQSESEGNKRNLDKARLGKNISRNKGVGSDSSQQRIIGKPEAITLGSASVVILVLILIAFTATGSDGGVKALISSIPAVAALAGTLVITYRWRRNYEQNAQKMDDENRRHREQTRNRRQENLGDRLASAIDHLSKTGVVEQVAGLTELAGIADDWWNLGQEMREEIINRYENDPRFTDDERDRQTNQIDNLVHTRRQEIIDLMFKTPLPTIEEDSQKEQLRDRQVQERRSQILRNHITDVKASDHEEKSAEINRPDLSNWGCLKFDYADLRYCDLREKDLRGIDLQHADCEGSNLTKANLYRAKLQDANLKTARLERTQLGQANLRSTNLKMARLPYADLQRAHLANAELDRAVLYRANLHLANLEEASMPCVVLQHANLEGANLYFANLQHAKLQNAKLDGARFFNANLTSAILDEEYSGSPYFDELTEGLSGEQDLENRGFSKVNPLE